VERQWRGVGASSKVRGAHCSGVTARMRRMSFGRWRSGGWGGGRWSAAVRRGSYNTVQEGERERGAESQRGGARAKLTESDEW
jgi:hypothetical protein